MSCSRRWTPAAIVAFAVVLAVVSTFSPASGQPAAGPSRVGMLTPATSATAKPHWDAFREAMKELGYVEGKNVVYEYRSAEGQPERLPQLAAELVKLPVKIMVVANTPGNLAAKKATTTIPIVMVAVGDPVRVGLVSNLGRPGGNITGFTNLTGQITAKRLQLIKEAIPTATRIGAIGDPGEPNSLESAFDAARTWRAQALIQLGGVLRTSLRDRTIELAAKTRIPVMYASRVDAEAGGLIGYGIDPADNYRRAADYVDRILKGAKPGELPVQQPTKVEMAVNLKTAAALGIKIPQPILVRADQVIE